MHRLAIYTTLAAMKRRIVCLVILLSLPALAVTNADKARVVDYFKILRASPADSSVPASIMQQLKRYDGSELEAFIIEGLKKEYQFRASAYISKSRTEI